MIETPVPFPKPSFIPLTRLERVWAYLTARQLQEEFYATSSQANKTALSKLIMDMALKYSLVTDKTSLVVVRPNDTNSAVDPQDASEGIFSEPSSELPMCNNITSQLDYQKYGTAESTTTESEPTTTELPTTTREFTCRDTSYGCCHDGMTSAAGPNYDGCDPIPKSEMCSLPKTSDLAETTHENGSTITKWQLVLNFGTAVVAAMVTGLAPKTPVKKRVLVLKAQLTVCRLPPSAVSCGESHRRWYYKKSNKTCIPFTYGGCLGNKNNFDTREVCHSTCLADSEINLQEACYLKEDSGPCDKYNPKWSFNKKKGRCARFWYGGCGGMPIALIQKMNVRMYA
ncbi:hypothetical protein NQ317_017948 [Molorchus minor]|uniref:BPTI/Kunitz inhibitor domain-containing protein n=1 Tax=Molorchus minor TaxID=1323400 RepID=A0ABQ9JF30_9CUCU|nr:hypothetical protein NQ317_017948 [Molorchus minor]